MFHTLTPFFRTSPIMNGVEVFLIKEKNDKRYIIKPCEFVEEEFKEGQYIPQPTFILPFETLKSFCNEANNFGIRLDDEAKKQGELIATKYHLEDLRLLLKLKT